MSKIIFLNGCGSSGKSTLAKAIQHLSDEPYFKIGVDLIIDTFPNSYLPAGKHANEGLDFVQEVNARGPSLNVTTGSVAQKAFNTLPYIAKLFAENDINLIIDEVILSAETLENYRTQLSAHKLLLVGVFCDYNTLLERELLRGDRAIGLSNGQFDLVHSFVSEYDLTVDTTRISAFELASTILSHF